MRKSPGSTGWVAILGILLQAGGAPAASFILGGASFATTEGSTNLIGGGMLSHTAITSQYQITASHLAAQGLLPGSEITGVRARLNGGGTMTADGVVSDLEITLAEAAFAIASMSSTLSSNMVDPVLVHDSAFVFDDVLMPGGATPNAFGQLISFTNPYTYQGGDLIFMFTHPGIAGGVSFGTDGQAGDGTSVRQMFLTSFKSNFGVSSSTFALLQFEFAAAPEPSRALLLLAGLAAVGLRRRR